MAGLVRVVGQDIVWVLADGSLHTSRDEPPWIMDTGHLRDDWVFLTSALSFLGFTKFLSGILALWAGRMSSSETLLDHFTYR